MENIIESLEMPESTIYQGNILDYMFRVQDIVAKYVKVYFDFKLNNISNVLKDKTEMKKKITSLCKLIIAMTKFIGARVNFVLKDNEKALDLIHCTFSNKINLHIQQYLVKIEFWVKCLPEVKDEK